MQINRKLAFISGVVACCSLGWYPVSAQVQVVEAGSSSGERSNMQLQPTAAENQNEIMVNMYLQLEALQVEVQNLRGLVEEQSYQIRRMQTEQRDRYLDTDSRLTEINNQVQTFHGGQQGIVVQPLAGSNPVQNANNGTNQNEAGFAAISPVLQGQTQGQVPGQITTQTGIATGAGLTSTTPQTEQELYRQALNLLLEDEAFEESITLFQQYIDLYPQGRYFTNTLYWQGAAMDLVGRYNQAIVVLQRLIDEYPQDAKAPTAMLRLGTVYGKMGNTTQALANWQRIAQLYPDSTSEIEIANEYIIDLSN